MADPLNSESPARQEPFYYNTPPQYPYASSQPILGTPVTAELTSPHSASVSALKYSAHNTYPISTPGVSGHCDTWAPSFRREIFSTVDYATPASSQGMPQPSMNCQFPLISHVYDIPRHDAQLPGMDSIHQRSM